MPPSKKTTRRTSKKSPPNASERALVGASSARKPETRKLSLKKRTITPVNKTSKICKKDKTSKIGKTKKTDKTSKASKLKPVKSVTPSSKKSKDNATREKTKRKALRSKIHPEEARYYLRSIDDFQAFWINNGPIIKNIEELHGVLNELDEYTFKHHVSSDHNDFYVWVTEVVGDQNLAKNFGKQKSKMIAALKSRINALKRAASS
jgi:hypothetical protein